MNQNGNKDAFGSQVLAWSLTIGGCICLGIGILVLLKSKQEIITRSFMALISVSILTMGLGNLLEPGQPLLASRFRFIAKVVFGFALFSLSWAFSH